MIYEYECPACGNVVEIERKMSDPESIYDCTTPTCETTLNRKYTAPVFKPAPGMYSYNKQA